MVLTRAGYTRGVLARPLLTALVAAGGLLGTAGAVGALAARSGGDGDPIQALRAAPGVSLSLRSELADRAELLEPASALPRTHHHARADLVALLAYAEGCGAPPELPAPLHRPLQWHQLRCAGAIPDRAWLGSGPAMHPLGQSYGALALEAGLDRATAEPHLHATERSGVLGSLPSEALGALASGTLLAEAPEYLLVREPGAWEVLPAYRVVERAVAVDALGAAGLELGGACDVPISGVCLSERPPARWPLVALVLGWGLLLAALGEATRQRVEAARAEREARAFVLRALTHELRTPATSVALAAEGLRGEVDALSPTGLDALGRVLDGAGRLRRTLDATSAFLALHHGHPEAAALELGPWLEQLAGDEVTVDAVDTTFRTDRRWLELAVRNLVGNALLHGEQPVRVVATMQGRVLCLTVSDAGRIERPLTELVEPFGARAASPGLGLGLPLVARVASALGGELALSPDPTAFTLRLPELP